MSKHKRCDCGHHEHHHDRDHCCCDHHDCRQCHPDHSKPDRPNHGDHGHGHGHGGKDGTDIGWKNPNRPGRHCGTSTGQVPGGYLEPGNFDDKPPNQWPGQRGDLYLPFLFMRANPGDLGARPVVGPFWESPDILLLAGVDPGQAPPVPPQLGQTALAGQPNTLYAHVWNFGISQAPCVVVEFYWCDPTLGIGPGSAHLIGQTTVALGARGSARSHAVVRCPDAWVPTFVNGGHECLVVRVWDETSDGIGTPEWDSALNRHVAQRNIHVIAAGQQNRALPGTLILPAPLTLEVGPLYGEPANVSVQRAAPHEMAWLQLRTGVRGQFPGQAAPTGVALLGAPRPIGTGTGLDGGATQHQVTDEHQQVAFHTTDDPPAPGEAHVYRVTASQQGQVFGGYTIVMLG
ncbi:hypothetical protein OG558_23710 [Kribbella sp. NBC_01510]|uniref:hypothetical protein n=1 Tax=Kribbella sp. NBC_01510 TaxID=2903581 RepID=UPI00386643B5